MGIVFRTAVWISTIGLMEASLTGSAFAQVHVRSEGSCAQCRVDLTPLASIGDDEGPGALAGEASAMAMDGQGRYFVLQSSEASVIKVFGADGEHVADLGRPGEGPGEFSFITHVLVDPSDSLYVFDHGVGRVSVFAPDLSLQREFRLIAMVEEAFFVGPNLIAINATRVPDRADRSVHLIRPTGEILTSFGREVHEPGVPINSRHRVAAGAGGSIWRVPRNEYVLERFDSTGNEVALLGREPSWFEPWERRSSGPDGVDPIIHAIRSAEDGTVRVVIGVADQEWSERLADPIQRGDREIYPVEAGTGMYDRVIEVLDPSSGEVLVSQRIEPELYGFLSPNLLYGYRVEPPGFPRIEVWRLQIDMSRN